MQSGKSRAVQSKCSFKYFNKLSPSPQAFSDAMKLKIHYLKHQSSKLSHSIEASMENSKSTLANRDNQSTAEPSVKSSSQDSEPEDLTKSSSSNKSTPSNPLMPNFVDNFSLQNFHLAQLALYQQHPFYYHHLYPLLTGQGVQPLASDILQQHIDQQKHQPSTSAKQLNPSQLLKLDAVQSAAVAMYHPSFPGMSASSTSSSSSSNLKRKLDEGLLSPSHSADGTISYLTKKMPKLKQGNFKMFKDEPIPTGYLKFRFNEDCNFTNCGYRNHQSHFHCCRNDCFYSFCDKTRFVQHTARHERLDKLMGDDFKQYRANMRCGYDECAYNKNMGKSIEDLNLNLKLIIVSFQPPFTKSNRTQQQVITFPLHEMQFHLLGHEQSGSTSTPAQ